MKNPIDVQHKELKFMHNGALDTLKCIAIGFFFNPAPLAAFKLKRSNLLLQLKIHE